MGDILFFDTMVEKTTSMMIKTIFDDKQEDD